MKTKTILIAIALACQTAAWNISAQTQANFNIQLGPRPFYLLDQLAEGDLKQQLSQCQTQSFHRSDFSIAHRGASLQFPEHTREAYVAAARMGAGIIECDVTFTQDQQLVCRHAQCDLHRTTDILARPALAQKCSTPFQPADPATNKPAQALCCTSDITLAEFKTLKGKMDGANPQATTVQEYMDGTPKWRTELYSATGTLMSFADSIDLFQSLKVKMTPELKTPEIEMPFQDNFTQEEYAESVVQLLKQKKVNPDQVFLQSFSWPDIKYWLQHYPQFGQQAVFLDDRVDNKSTLAETIASLPDLKAQGLSIIAPPLWALLALDEHNNIILSDYAKTAKEANLKVIAWSLERSGHISRQPDYYYSSFQSAIKNEGDIYRVLNILHKDLGVLGVFSDWPAAVTFYANCMGL